MEKQMRERNINTAGGLGQLLMDNQLIIPHDLEFALEHQQYSNEPLGQILVRMGALDKRDLDKILVNQ